MRLYCVIGHPVAHSMSPDMQNAAFRRLGLNFRYESVDVSPGQLPDFVKAARYSYAGFNVTIPHKIEILGLLDGLSREAELIGAVNTVKCEKKLTGHNTDGLGCVKALGEAGVEVKDKRILVVGAGGAARAITFQLALEGAKVALSNRTKKKAVDLACDVKAKAGVEVGVVDFEPSALGEALKEVDVFINSTSVGMSPNVSESVIEAALLPNDIVVMDLVYNPVKTKLLSVAAERGCKTVDGVGMLVHQGAEALRIWLGVEPPVDAMRKAVVQGLERS